jgi:hypothetical protein|tara:strand:- start:379 stop:576 length:198 start_codon:yes stop_codon:yes gene_type:complete
MDKTNLTRVEVSLLIHSVQRTLIKLEQYDPDSELVRKHRLLIKTLLDIEQELNTEVEQEPISIYK